MSAAVRIDSFFIKGVLAIEKVMITPSKKTDRLLMKAREGGGLCPEEVRLLISESAARDWETIFAIAQELTYRNFGNHLFFYVPLYFSNSCVNDCLYCGFRRANRATRRLRLTARQFVEEAALLWLRGHRTLLLVAGEHPILAGADRICALVSELVREDLPFSVSLEVGPLSVGEYGKLRSLGISRCVLYQETYDREIYTRIHTGPKSDFEWRYEAMGRAVQAGFKDVGLGFLLGLNDWKKDLPELIRHAYDLKNRFGRLPSTLSFPRIRRAQGLNEIIPQFPPVSDGDFEKIIALARLALPSAGITLTTRENPEFRDRLLERGTAITHVSAGSSTQPGGYSMPAAEQEGQFEISDRRSLDEMLAAVKAMGFKPVLAKPGQRLSGRRNFKPVRIAGRRG